MKHPRSLYIIALVGLVVGVLVWMHPAPQSGQTHPALAWIPGLRAQDTATNSKTAEATPSPADVTGDARSVSPEFTQRFTSEASRLEQFSGDPASQKATLRAWAQNFSASETQFLKDKALSQNSTANERILSTYLLTLTVDASPGSKALEEFVLSPLQIAPGYKVHSPEETLAAQEKALRRMGIDSLVERAQRQGQTEQLERTLDQIQDPALRDHAKKALKKRP